VTVSGAIDVLTLRSLWSRQVPVYDRYRRRTLTSFDYEQELLGKPLHPEDQASIKLLRASPAAQWLYRAKRAISRL
jgi:hypothetical protein